MGKKLEACSVTLLITKLLTFEDADHTALMDEFGPLTKLSDVVEQIVHLEVPRSVVDSLVHDADVQDALSALDIDPHDNKRLYDILDADHSGKIGVVEFVFG